MVENDISIKNIVLVFNMKLVNLFFFGIIELFLVCLENLNFFFLD